MRMNDATNDTLDSTVELFKAFADPVRLRLLSLIAVGEVCVCHLHEALDLPQSTVSRHLAYLRQRGLVTGRKEGLWVYYRLATPASGVQRSLLDGLGQTQRGSSLMKLDHERLQNRLCCED